MIIFCNYTYFVITFSSQFYPRKHICPNYANLRILLKDLCACWLVLRLRHTEEIVPMLSMLYIRGRQQQQQQQRELLLWFRGKQSKNLRFSAGFSHDLSIEDKSDPWVRALESYGAFCIQLRNSRCNASEPTGSLRYPSTALCQLYIHFIYDYRTQ